jgi:hypothetical protein
MCSTLLAQLLQDKRGNYENRRALAAGRAGIFLACVRRPPAKVPTSAHSAHWSA